MFDENNAEKAGGSGAEGAPSLRSVRFDVKTIEEAVNRASELNPADGSDMHYILSNPDSEEADKLKDGSFHFFFGAIGNGCAPYVYWKFSLNMFARGSFALSRSWNGDDRAVLRS